MKKVSKTIVTIRLDNLVIQEIDSKCNAESCCRSDFIKKAISKALEVKNEPVSEVKVQKISYDDGKLQANHLQCNSKMTWVVNNPYLIVSA